MYTKAGADLRFGDVFRAEWLFDSYVRADSAAMFKRTFCEIANLTGSRDNGRRPRGRVLMGAVRKLDDKQQDDLELGMHTLPPEDALGFPGGLVDFNHMFEVQTNSLLDASDQKALSLDDEDRYTLGERFAGHLLRQGAFAAGVNARKLSRLLTAGDDIALLKELSSDADNGGIPGRRREHRP